jgi:hypothetical protein
MGSAEGRVQRLPAGQALLDALGRLAWALQTQGSFVEDGYVEEGYAQTTLNRLSSASVRISWACLLKRVFSIDIEHCLHCGGNMKIIAATLEASAADSTLKCNG